VRAIPLTVRLNPMYAAAGSKWAARALASPDYRPPRLTDVIALAETKRAQGVNIYVGASTEGLDDVRGNYRGREDFSPALLKRVKIFNAAGQPLPECR
jgi:hypothetical protein